MLFLCTNLSVTMNKSFLKTKLFCLKPKIGRNLFVWAWVSLIKLWRPLCGCWNTTIGNGNQSGWRQRFSSSAPLQYSILGLEFPSPQPRLRPSQSCLRIYFCPGFPTGWPGNDGESHSRCRLGSQRCVYDFHFSLRSLLALGSAFYERLFYSPFLLMCAFGPRFYE